MGVFNDFCRGIANHHPARHSQMNNPLAMRTHGDWPLPAPGGRGGFAIALQFEHDVLSHTVHFRDARVFQRSCDLRRARFHGLRLGTQPH